MTFDKQKCHKALLSFFRPIIYPANNNNELLAILLTWWWWWWWLEWWSVWLEWCVFVWWWCCFDSEEECFAWWCGWECGCEVSKFIWWWCGFPPPWWMVWGSVELCGAEWPWWPGWWPLCDSIKLCILWENKKVVKVFELIISNEPGIYVCYELHDDDKWWIIQISKYFLDLCFWLV